MDKIMDVGSGVKGVQGRLSNLTKRVFIFDGVKCNSIEGVLQGIKFKDRDIQLKICGLSGMEAKRSGYKSDWKDKQTINWNGREMKRDSIEYQELLNELYQAAFDQNEQYREDILSCEGIVFTHTIGKDDIRETILTIEEFTSRLTKLRDRQSLIE